MATLPINIYGDTVTAVLNTARSRVDDLILTPAGSPSGSDPGQQFTEVGGGTLMNQLNPDGSLVLRTQVIFNSAWRKCQRYLTNLGWRGMIETIIIENIPPNTADIAKPSWISWNGNFDGTTFASSPALPQEFLSPLDIRERVNGSGAIFQPMVVSMNGLRVVPTRSELSRQWVFEKNAIYIFGATGATDLQIRCRQLIPDFVGDITTSPATPWYYQKVPIPNILSALAWYVVYEVMVARVGEDKAAGALANAENEAGQVFNDQAQSDRIMPSVNTSIPRPTPSPQQN